MKRERCAALVFALLALVLWTSARAREGWQASAGPVLAVQTGIDDIRSFLQRCPANDPAYATIRQNIELRLDGNVITDPVTCSEPVSPFPITGLNSTALNTLQAFRVAYSMNAATERFLPWTSKGIYTWMIGNIAGVNFRTAPGPLYCWDIIDG